jgi:dipeptidase E
MKKRLLLISNSFQFGRGFLDHCCDEIFDFLGTELSRVLFVPFALEDRDRYAAKARERLGRIGFQVDSLHESPDPIRAVKNAQAIFIGGGNTFRLLRTLYDRDILKHIQQRVGLGTPYIGSSAGSNVACPTIMTTNDMPIVEPPSFVALGLVPFQINPHYIDIEPGSTHQGETREQRILEFLEENDRIVVALREGAMLRVEGLRMVLKGSSGARVFARGVEPREIAPNCSVDFLLNDGVLPASMSNPSAGL